jgi:peptidoglycan/xylan/chitin deacetylase (PgdA/CDA1 family)
MTRDHVAQLAAEGFAIGAHTASHARLPSSRPTTNAASSRCAATR